MSETDSRDPAATTAMTRAASVIRKLRTELAERSGPQPLAVVGIGLRLPGGIEDPEGYWQALVDGRDLIRPLPETRKGPFGADWDDLVRNGGFFDEVLDFDADFFGIGTAEACRLDPQHRLLLEVGWEALENAALPPDRIDGAATGLFVGITGHDYWDWHGADTDSSWATGNGHCFAVGRPAYAMGVGGPVLAVDTACSSSLVAVHLARQALHRRECDVALAGGVNLVLSPRSTEHIQRTGALSPDGRCRAFDARANGFARGEGCGIVVLKRLADARRDGDRIHAVLHGSAVNHVGRSTGFAAPNVPAQIRLIEAALADAGLSPADIGVVEAHGTGTSLGDTIEMEAIVAALGRRNGGAPLRVGSVKPNLGHLESAAGIVSLIKAVLCLRHRGVPPLAHFGTLNPLIDLSGTGITVPTGLEPWADDRSGRCAAVSAFGMGGTNAHVVLGPAEPSATEPNLVPVPGFELSATTPEALRALAARFRDRLAELPDDSYPAFAYTATFGRARHASVARVEAPDRGTALRELAALADGTRAASPAHDRIADDPGPLPRSVLDLPPYPWQRRHCAPERIDVPPTPPRQDRQTRPPAEVARTGTGPETAADPVADLIVDLRWRELTGDPGTGASRAADAGWWLLFADRTGLADALRSEITARAGTCVLVTPGDRYRRLGADRYQIDPVRQEDFGALLGDLRAARSSPCLVVVHALALDVPPAADADHWGPLWTASAAAMASATYLARALATAEWRDETVLALVTRGAHRVLDADAAPAVGQAPLCGLGRVLRREHAQARTRLVDLEPAPAPGETARLVEELLRPDGPGQLALRGDARYRPRLEPAAPTAGASPVVRRPFLARRDGNHRITALRPGVLDSLTPTRSARTAPGPGQVEIEVTAAGLNFSDVLKAMDAYPGLSGGTAPLGVECAGRISAVGTGVTGHRVGDPVLAVARSSLAAFVTTPAEFVVRKPDALTDEQAAALPIAFLTAVYGLEHLGRLRTGETVLIHSATGGVGLAALQVARRCGAEVFATAGTPEKRELLRSLGVDHVLDSRSLAFADEIADRTHGRGVDVVLNSTVGEALVRSLELLAPGGRFVEIGKRDVYQDSQVGLGHFKHNRSLHAIDLEWSLREQPDLIAGLLREVVRGVADGELTALPVTGYPYAEANAAFTRMARARHIGKLVLRPGEREDIAVRLDQTPVRRPATYLVTGGLGTLGLEIARYLAGQGARHLVLVDRRGPSATAERAVEELRSLAEVVVLTEDISRYDAVTGVLARIDAALPPLAGVVHADGGDPRRAAESGRSTGRPWIEAAPTVAGAWHLHRATRDRALDFFVLCSSLTGLTGAPGPGGGAVAGAFLDALAVHRVSCGLPALGIDWGPWAGSGPTMAGIRGLSRPEGIAALDRLLRTRVGQAGVLAVEPDARFGGDEEPLAGLAGASAVTERSAGTGTGIRAALLAVEPGPRRRTLLVRHCAEVAARTLGVATERIDPTAPLAGLGFDSPSSLELRTRLAGSLGVTLPATLVWRFPTIDAMVPYLAEHLAIPIDVEPEAGPDPEADLGSDLGSDLDGLSDDELEALLLAKTEQIDGGTL